MLLFWKYGVIPNFLNVCLYENLHFMGTKVTLLELFCLLEAKRNESGGGASGIYGFIASINVGNPPRWWKSPTTEKDPFQTKKKTEIRHTD